MPNGFCFVRFVGSRLKYMKVFKFGGASVKSAEGVRELVEIVKTEKGPMIIVISAMGKTTNQLERLTRAFFEQTEDKDKIFSEVKTFHTDICQTLFGDNYHQILPHFSNLFDALFLKISGQVSLNFDYEYDQIVTFGELISTRIVSLYLQHCGINNRWIDIRQVIKTDNTYREARVDWNLTKSLFPRFFDTGYHGFYITQGFIGSTSENFSTTLGREGSDYTAAILSYIANASEMVVWKDVPGVLNADPRLFDNAVKLPEISYLEAIEMSYYGAQVIHPKTMKPLQNKNIPLYVKSFLHPQDNGTLIHQVDHHIKLAPIIIIKENQVLVSISPSDFSFIAEHNLSDIFALFAQNRLKVNLSQNSALSFSVCTDDLEQKYLKVIGILKNDYKVKYNEKVTLITIRHYNDEIIEKLISGKTVLVEQKSRNTARFVVKSS